MIRIVPQPTSRPHWRTRIFAESSPVWSAPASCGSISMSRIDIARA